jgi:hypothetical protein
MALLTCRAQRRRDPGSRSRLRFGWGPIVQNSNLSGHHRGWYHGWKSGKRSISARFGGVLKPFRDDWIRSFVDSKEGFGFVLANHGWTDRKRAGSISGVEGKTGWAQGRHSDSILPGGPVRLIGRKLMISGWIDSVLGGTRPTYFFGFGSRFSVRSFGPGLT